MEITDGFRVKMHRSMAVVGGFIGAYALLTRHDVFGNAQTSNMIWLAMCILGRNWGDVLIRLGGLAIYVLGIVTVTLWPRITKIDVHFLAVAIDGVCLLCLGMLPKEMNIVISLYPVFYAAAVQWCAFPGVYGYNCSTIFSTNNLKQFTTASVEYICTKDAKFAQKAKFYGSVLLSYHLGVMAEFVLYQRFQILSAYFGLIFVAVTTGFVLVEQKRLKKLQPDNKFKTCCQAAHQEGNRINNNVRREGYAGTSNYSISK